MTVCAMRYLSDLSIGRVNPNRAKFGPKWPAKVDLADFLRTQILPAINLNAAVAQVEAPLRRFSVPSALAAYEKLAAKGDGAPVPPVEKGSPGGDYPGCRGSSARLHLLGGCCRSPPLPADQTACQRRRGRCREDDSSGVTASSPTSIIRQGYYRRSLDVPVKCTRPQELPNSHSSAYRLDPPAFSQPPDCRQLPSVHSAHDAPFRSAVLTLSPVVVGKAYLANRD